MVLGARTKSSRSEQDKLSAAVVSDLPDGSGITEQSIVDHADKIIADAEARRQRINSDGE